MTFNLRHLRRRRIADQCVCCGSQNLRSKPAILMPFVAHRCFGWKPTLIDESWELNTVKKGMAYTVCNSLQCRDCDLLFSDIRFSDDELERLYHGYRNTEYSELRETYEPGYTLRNNALAEQINYGNILERFLDPLLPARPLAILDWGGDSGKNTPLRKRAHRHDVYDISDITVVTGARAVTRDAAMNNSYDLIVCSNVLEHVPYPSDLLFDIKQVMRPESLLYIEIPYEEALRSHGQEALNYKRHWHEHVNFFSPESIRVLLHNCKFKTIAITYDSFITAGLKTSFLMQIACRVA